jgi:two-component system, chemotaxis family, chemotaxis protein CheY
MTQGAEPVAGTAVTDTIVFDLPPEIDADGAAALIADMIKLPQANAISLNAAAVSSVSLGYLQILVSAFKTFPQLTVSAVSAEFAEAFGGYGIAYPFAEPAAAQAEAPVADMAAAESEPPTQFAPMPEAAPVETASLEAAPGEAAPVEAVAPPLVPDAPASTPAAEADSNSAAEAAGPRTILTIDDSRTMRDMLRLALSGAGFTVVQAVDGQDGLKVLPQQPVDVIITDINMPKLDGYGVIRAVRGDPAYDDTPILVLSTEAEQGSKDIANEAGANGWIVKPFDPEGLVKLINTVCE